MKDKKIFKKLIHIAAKDKWLIVLSFVLTFIEVVSSLAGPLLIGGAINAVGIKGKTDFNLLFKLTALLASVYVINAASSYFVSYINSVLSQKSVLTIRNMFMAKLQKLPLRFFDGNSHGDIISRMTNDIETIGEGVLQGFSQLFSGIITIIGIIAFMISINLYVALAIIFISPLSVFVAVFITKRTQKYFKQQQEAIGRLNGIAEEMINGQKVLTAFNYGGEAVKKFQAANEELKKTSMKSNFYSSLTNPSVRFVNNIVYVVAGIFGIYLGLSVGDISSFLMYSNKYAKPFNEISSVISQFQSALAAAERVFAIIESKEEPPESEGELPALCTGKVNFTDVSFSYNKEVPLIRNLNLFVDSGKKIAIVGRTGSGKTTLVNLLMRFYDIDGGSIEIDGTDIYSVTRKSLRNRFAMVLQDTFLFKATVAQNISYGKPEATPQQIENAAKLAHCHDFITKLADGYDTVISEQGGSLSEGQKQLLCIARVMLLDSPMLILDEATSNIDTRTEMLIQKAFDYLTKGKTSFVIAHRLSTIINADLILVLENGNITEQGTHEQLLAAGKEYYKLYNSQFAGRAL